MSEDGLRVLRAGRAVLLELPGLEDVLTLLESLRTAPLEGTAEAVPAARTILLRPDDATSWEKLAERAMQRWRHCAHRDREVRPSSAQTVTIPVLYDGEDLHDVARLCGMSSEDVIARHTAASYTVAFTGFAPGFGYLAGGDPVLYVPRRERPRTAVPAGAVGLAGEFSGVYPRSSPGGWQLIGRSDVVLFDAAAEPPALLRPGTPVRFEAVDELTGDQQAGESDHAAPATGAHAAGEAEPTPALEVLESGAQTLIQDLGRPGRAELGVGASGAMDRAALRRVNRLVGNVAGAPALEHVGGGLRLLATQDLVLAVTGAETPVLLEGAPAEHSYPLKLPAGRELELGAPRTGTYAYVGIRGLTVPQVLGSSSRDVLAGLGPEPLHPGAQLTVDAIGAAAVVLGEAGPAVPRAGEQLWLDVVLGPRTDWFTDEALHHLVSQDWEVTERSNRVGLRLAGEHPLQRLRHEELPSEPTVRGALQVPAEGQPVLFAADHPLTGGYPVIACVAEHHLDLAAQAPPGTRLRFRLPGGGSGTLGR